MRDLQICARATQICFQLVGERRRGEKNCRFFAGIMIIIEKFLRKGGPGGGERAGSRLRISSVVGGKRIDCRERVMIKGRKSKLHYQAVSKIEGIPSKARFAPKEDARTTVRHLRGGRGGVFLQWGAGAGGRATFCPLRFF